MSGGLETVERGLAAGREAALASLAMELVYVLVLALPASCRQGVDVCVGFKIVWAVCIRTGITLRVVDLFTTATAFDL